jgi:hypothetical protein
MRMTVETEQPLQDGGTPEYVCHSRTGMAAKDIHKEMLPMYSEHCLSRHVDHNWVQKFSEGRKSIENERVVRIPIVVRHNKTT